MKWLDFLRCCIQLLHSDEKIRQNALFIEQEYFDASDTSWFQVNFPLSETALLQAKFVTIQRQGQCLAQNQKATSNGEQYDIIKLEKGRS